MRPGFGCSRSAPPPWSHSPSSATAQTSEPELLDQSRRAPVYLDGELVFEVRGSTTFPAGERAKMIVANLEAAARNGLLDPAMLEQRKTDDSIEIWGAGRRLFGGYPVGVRLEGLDLQVLADADLARVQSALADFRAARSPQGIRRALRDVGAAALALGLAFAIIVFLARRTSRFIARYLDRHISIWEQRARNVMRLQTFWQALRGLLQLIFVGPALLVFLAWLNFALRALPWTRGVARGVSDAAINRPAVSGAPRSLRSPISSPPLSS